MLRIGHGYDVHKFGGEGPVIIGGVNIPFDMGLIAHSDGDVALHAICDAILGALALGDIGKHFPDTDEKFSGIDSRTLLRHVFKLATDKGYQLGNLDTTIVAQAPTMAPHIDMMRANIADDLAACVSQVNVKATTTEQLGFTGRKEGIAVHAVVLLCKKEKS
jgi:2-C-methyl-D-erythritol 2,4-cyclodiphosphate synthase